MAYSLGFSLATETREILSELTRLQCIIKFILRKHPHSLTVMGVLKLAGYFPFSE